MIKNEILLKKICQLISMTFALPVEKIMEDAKQIGVDKVIELLENPENNVRY
jgi:hypothetical protein